MHYSYHGRIQQRIKAGELVGYKMVEDHPRIGKCLLLLFKTEPFIRPIRPRRYAEYQKILNDWRMKDEKSKQ